MNKYLRETLAESWPYLVGIGVALVVILILCICSCPAASGQCCVSSGGCRVIGGGGGGGGVIFPPFTPIKSTTTATAKQKPKCPWGCSERCQCGCNEGEPCRCASRGTDGVWRRHLDLAKKSSPAAAPPAAAAKKMTPVVVMMATSASSTTGAAKSSDTPEEPNFGVDKDKISKEPQILRGDKAIGRKEAIKLLEGKNLEDDTAKLRLTIIGPEADRKRVLADIESNPVLSVAVKERCLVQAYAPDHWAVKNLGFVTTGKPTIYLQRADGKVLHRQEDYRGPEKLTEAIRKADPKYDTARDPDLNKPWWEKILPADLSKVPTSVWVIGGAGVLLLLSRNQQKQ